MKQAEYDGIPADNRDTTAKALRPARLLQEQAEQDRGNGGDGDEQRQFTVGCQAPAEEVQTANDQLQDIAPEVDDDGGQRAHMHHDIGHQPLVLPTREVGDQDQMAG